MFILHAEHELNCSTSAVRHLASSGVDVYSAVAGAVAALYGPLHGGANEAVLRMLGRIGSVENIPAFLDRVKSKKARARASETKKACGCRFASLPTCACVLRKHSAQADPPRRHVCFSPRNPQEVMFGFGHRVRHS